MKNILKKFYAAILCGAMLLGVCLACACSKSGGGSKSGGKTERAFMSVKDYEEVKSELYGAGALSSGAKARVTEELVVGQTYCFVYAFELKDTAPQMSERGLRNYFNLSLKTWGGIYSGADAVEYVGFDYDDSGMDARFDCDYGAMLLKKKSEGYYEEGLYHHFKSFICVKFVPKYAGTIYVESNIYGNYYKKAEDKTQWVSASVFESASAAQNGAKCNISRLSCGLVSGDVYNDGLLKDDTDLAAISEMKIGENYVVVDFDIESVKSDGTDEVYCGIYLHNGAWKDAVMEDANTAKIVKTEVDDGTIFDFSYKVPASGSRKIRTVLSFTALEVCLVDIDFYMFSDVAAIGGATFSGEHFAETSVATLKYEIDEDMQICRVKGLDSRTGKVIIPDRYNGYPVLEIEEGAFSGASINSLVIGDMVQTVGYGAFENCSGLRNVTFGKKLNTIESKAFKCCTSLTDLLFPASLYLIQYEAFSACSLKSVKFENEIGWQLMSSKKDSIYSGFLSVLHPQTAAKYLSDTYANVGWYYCATAKIENLAIGAVVADDYTDASGNSDTLDGLIANKSYVLLIDFDLTTYSQVVGPEFYPNTIWLGITLNSLLNLNTDTLKLVSGEFYGETYVTSGGVGLQCMFPANIGDTRHYRIACSFKPKFGGSKLEMKFDGGYGKSALYSGAYQISERFSVEFG